MKYGNLCGRCVMDDTAAGFFLDDRGLCNFCSELLARNERIGFKIEVNQTQLERLVSSIKKDGAKKKYDCIVGISGGVDSSYVLAKVVELGLRPLAVHMDNGWNSELAQNNIFNLVDKLGVDLHTHVIDWSEYRGLMQAFFDADVIDVELLYDNAMRAVNYDQARKYGIKYMLSGVNTATEGIGIPKNWNWNKADLKNIKSISRTFNGPKIKTFPGLSSLQYLVYMLLGYKSVPFLDYIRYDKQEAIDYLMLKFDYKPYPYKHYESIFTRFYQGFLLPEKFNVDKRKMHLSSLIISDQMTRAEALEVLAESPYPSQEELREDKLYFLKKMKWEKSVLENYLNRPGRAHSAYPHEGKIWLIAMFYVKKLTSLVYKAW